MMTIYKELHEIQKKLKAPKGQWNGFGKYNYRSCEDIVEAVKPLLAEGTVLLLDDEMVNIGQYNYISASATLRNETDAITATGWARESATKKGMDDSQITGSTSSYARKYALNGLFAIDDTKDADTNEARNQGDNAPKVTKAPKVEVSVEDKLKAATAFVDGYLKQLVDVKTKDELMALQTKNSSGLDSIRNKYQSLNEHIIKITKELKLES
jgi:hypothetical protein